MIKTVVGVLDIGIVLGLMMAWEIEMFDSQDPAEKQAVSVYSTI